MRSVPAARLLLALFATAATAATTGCKASYAERIADFQFAWQAGDFPEAESAIDDILIDETGVEAGVVSAPKLLAESDALGRHDGQLLLLEKGLARFANGDPAGAAAILRRARDELDAHADATAVDYLESTVLDDNYRAYRGYDHEVILVRVMIAMCDLLQGGQDALPIAMDIDRKQQELLDNGFGAESGFDYRALFPRISLGAYLEGVIHESQMRTTEAKKAYRRARDEGADLDALNAALKRVDRGRYVETPGNGVVHAFLLLGRSPNLLETHSAPTEFGRALASTAITIIADAGSAAMQVPIKVPQVKLLDEIVAPLSIEAPGMKPVISEPIIDLNGLFAEELEATMPWIISRAMVRRSVKAAAAATLEKVISESIDDEDYGDEVAFLAGAALNLGSTAVEDADVRCWTSLPAQVHVARIELPPGRHDLSFGAMTRARVQVSAGHESYVVVIVPDPALPGVALIDKWSGGGAD